MRKKKMLKGIGCIKKYCKNRERIVKEPFDVFLIRLPWHFIGLRLIWRAFKKTSQP